MRKRTFFIRLNLDDMADDIFGLDSTKERGEWLEGFLVGSRGKPQREDWPQPKLDGHLFGSQCFVEAEAFRERQSEKGLASAEARRNQSRTESEPRFNHGSTTVQPEANQTSTYPTSNIQHPEDTKPKIQRSKVFVPPTIEEATAYAKEIGFDRPSAWMDYYTANGWKVGKSKMVDWKAAMRNWKSKDGAAFAAPTIREWMEEGERIAASNPTRVTRKVWPRDLCQSAYHAAAANGWRGVTDWRGKIQAECLRWVGLENGRLPQ